MSLADDKRSGSSLSEDIKAVREILTKHFNRPESLVDIDLARIDVLVDQFEGGSLVKNHEAVDRILKLAAIGEQIHPVRLTRILDACEAMEKALEYYCRIYPESDGKEVYTRRARGCIKNLGDKK